MDILFSEAVSALARAVILVVVLFEDEGLVGRSEQINISSGHALKQAVTISNFQESSFGEARSVVMPNAIENYPEIKSIILINAGKAKDFDRIKAEKIGGKIYKEINRLKVTEASVLMESSGPSIVSYIANGIALNDFDFNKYKTVTKKNDHTINKIEFIVDNQEYINKEFKSLFAVTRGVQVARNFVTEPPNILYPKSYAEQIQSTFKGLDKCKVEILDEKAMAKHGMNALLGVGQGSSKESRLVIIQYNGSDNRDEPPVSFVGKGVTFDTGGISLKPPRGMWDMKYDMAGSASVVGAMYALAARDARVNAVGIVGLAENAISGDAQRPSDVVKSMSGQTIEVLNTDAEGRLVLADALSYVQQKFSPKCIVDLATLTGAIVVALGDQYAGLFSNDDELAENLTEAGKAVNEGVWRFPLSKEYDKYMDSDIADVKNISLKGAGADSITAAQFLQRFVNKEQAWAHLDIAGMAWDKEGSDIAPKGATGFGVRLLNEFVSKFHEE